MAKQVFSPGRRGMSQATRVGNMVFVSGQVSVDPAGNIVALGDIKGQSVQVFKNLEQTLNAAGAKLTDVVKTTSFLVNADDGPAFREERSKVFPKDAPASTSVIVKSLSYPEYLLEVEAIAVIS